jgi:hypothetical protein
MLPPRRCAEFEHTSEASLIIWVLLTSAKGEGFVWLLLGGILKLVMSTVWMVSRLFQLDVRQVLRRPPPPPRSRPPKVPTGPDRLLDRLTALTRPPDRPGDSSFATRSVGHEF